MKICQITVQFPVDDVTVAEAEREFWGAIIEDPDLLDLTFTIKMLDTVPPASEGPMINMAYWVVVSASVLATAAVWVVVVTR